MLKIFGHPGSTCTRKVLMTLAEANTPYELTVVDLAKGDHKQQPHLVRQPFGQIPTIDDAGFTLYESRAICRYLNERLGGSLVPTELQARARMEQWISVETSNFTPHAMKFVYHHVFQRAQDPAVLEVAGKSLELALGVMDATLAKSPFLVGGQFTLADVFFMPYLGYLDLSPVKAVIAKYPHVSAWWSQASQRATWKKATGQQG